MKRKRCHYCRIELTAPTPTRHQHDMFTRDHIYPKSLGGTKTVPCCWRCNNVKGDDTPDQWAKFRADNPDWTKLRTRADVVNTKAIQRAEIFRRIRIAAIQPAWPAHVFVPPRQLCRGLPA